jgi:cytochrome c biogenesis protein CcmG/thiol:disulfide interchange protein DsbE
VYGSLPYSRCCEPAAMTRKLLFLVPVVLFAVLLVAFAIGLRHDPRLVPSALIDRPAPDFALPGLYQRADGLTRKDLDGRVTLVNFFASWCAPCREEHPQLMTLGHLPGVTLDGVAYKDKPEDSRSFLDRLGNPYGHVGIDRAGTTAIDFGVYGVPETYLIDGTGHIRYRHVGPLTAGDVKEKILPMIERLTESVHSPQGSGSRSSLETAARKPGRSRQP